MKQAEISRKDAKKLVNVRNFLRFARDRVDPDITAQRLVILITVCLNEGLSQNELLQDLERTSVTALSRNLADLSVLSSRKVAGPGLIEMRNDPMNLRKKRVYLTDAGRDYLSKWLATMK